MTIVKFIKKIFFVELFKGMAITLREMFAGALTEQYPKDRPILEERFRGEPRMMVDENGKTLCITCMLCQQICPENCITIDRERDPETKKFVLKGYTYNLQRCLFCGFCEEVCPTDCIQLTPQCEMAFYSRDDFVRDWKSLEEGMEVTHYRK
jgi:NADH-quinone oxidoreductase chain I